MMLLELFLTFLKIGAFTFGGGYAMLPLITAEVEAHGWMDEQALVNFIAVSESTPGPFAVNIATYVGMEVRGIPGATCATLGVILPSFAVILIIAKCYQKFQNSRIVKGCMSGLKPAVVGLIGASVLSVGSTVFIPSGASLSIFCNEAFYVSAGIFVLAAALAFRKVHPILIICVCAVLGMITGYAFGL